MMMKPALLRRLAFLLLALFGFAQGSVALAACTLDRGTLSTAMAAPQPGMQDDCDNSAMVGVRVEANRCLAHCTADLQVCGDPVALAHAPAPAFFMPVVTPHLVMPKGLDVPPPGAPPARILLHSFLI